MTEKRKLRIKQVRSSIREEAAVRKTLTGLRLNKVNRISHLEDTPSVRGMVEKVKHLVVIQD